MAHTAMPRLSPPGIICPQHQNYTGGLLEGGLIREGLTKYQETDFGNIIVFDKTPG